MAKKLSLIILGDSGTTLRRCYIAYWQLIIVTMIIFATILVVVSGFFQYISFQSRLAQKHIVEQRLNHQTAEIDLKRRQVQKFSIKINELKEQLLALNQLEGKIRTIAHINPQGNSDDLFGVGGSMPEDLNTNTESAYITHMVMEDVHRQAQWINPESLNPHTSFEIMLNKLTEQKNLLAHTPSIRPAKGSVSSRFGYRESPFREALELHKGLDIVNHKGAPVVATADGMVSFIGVNGTFGRMMVIDHGFGITTRYAHIDKSLKKPGEMVHRGEQIALMGDTGRSTGTHLHYEVRFHGVPINPENYFSE